MTVGQAERTVPLLMPGLLESGRFRHREALLKRRLDARGQSLFEPGEQIVLTFDGVTRLPTWRIVGSVVVGEGIGMSLGGVVAGLYDRHRLRSDRLLVASLRRDRLPLPSVDWYVLDLGLGILVAGLVIAVTCRLLGSRRVMVAMTTMGVVECRTDWFGRARAVIQRGPADESVFRGGRRNCRRVVIGPVDVYTGYRTEEMLPRRSR